MRVRRKLVSQVKSVSSTQHHDTSTWLVSAAPGSDEVIWGNVRRARVLPKAPWHLCPQTWKLCNRVFRLIVPQQKHRHSGEFHSLFMSNVCTHTV